MTDSERLKKLLKIADQRQITTYVSPEWLKKRRAEVRETIADAAIHGDAKEVRMSVEEIENIDIMEEINRLREGK